MAKKTHRFDAKRKPAKLAAGKAPKSAARGTKRSSGASPRSSSSSKRTGPRSQPLPGMEQVRNAKLDRFCESIGEMREQMNTLRADESGELQGALREMHDRNVTAYRHAGVEMVRVPGEEKIRVRTSKEKASDMTPSDTGDDDRNELLDELTDGKSAAAGA